MPLSRLENFLKNAEGNILYVNPSDFDATDSFENRGNSLTRPFRTIQRALIEAARFSYQVGRNNDKIDNTTILVYPGTHYIDNRPGYSIQNVAGSAVFKTLSNSTWVTTPALSEFSENSNFDIFDQDNDLYKFNSVEGGVILPRGTSIVGLDLRKTKIRPMYVPDPKNADIPNSAIFRVTGTCYFTSFTVFDADIQRPAYKDQSGSKVTPNFSHHKLTVFEYADGVNKIFLNNSPTDLTDLEMYYYKITYAYGDTSGRGLPNYPVSTGTDFEPSIDEYRIVGDLAVNPIGITSIRSGDGNVPTRTITIDTDRPHGLFKDTPVLISGISTNVTAYNGSFLVSDVIDENTFTFTAVDTPTDPLPSPDKFLESKVTVESDSVSSASPYIFSCTLRSVYGMNGMHADGNKATGFKSMLVAQFTGISLQKDDDAFILYDEQTGIYNDNSTVAEDQKPLHINSRAIYKPEYENVHIKTSNDAIIQCVSIFAIGYAKHFVSDSGGDQSITNSNSNFGAISLEASGFRKDSFDRDDVGYITHIIPPREPEDRESSASWLSLDSSKIVSVGKTERLYISEYTNSEIIPPYQIDSYRIGAKRGELLYLSTIVNNIEQTDSSPVLMTVPSGIGTSAEKIYTVGRKVGINSISNNIITFETNHQLFNGEKIRVFSDTGELPSNVQLNKVYYAITTGLNANQIKLANTLNDANNNNNITGISNGGGVLKIISSVSDKKPGDFGHPIQFDTTENQWYILSSSDTNLNKIYSTIVGIGTSILGETTGTTFVTRKVDNRGLEDRIYKLRYVIPKEHINARPPSEGFIIQESKSVGIGSVSFLTSNIQDPTQLKNPKIIVSATANTVTKTASFKTEQPHNLIVGDLVTISNIVSTGNTTGNSSLPYNGTYEVVSTNSTREFSVFGEEFAVDPGTFLNQTNLRSTQQQIESLPTVRRENYKNTLFIYRISEIKKHIPGVDGQDGVYTITAISGSVSPDSNVGFGISEKKFNQDIRNLYPQQDRDNLNSDPQPSTSYALLSPLGRVVTNDRRNSITKESLNYFLENNRVGYAITGAVITGTGNTTITLYTNVDHNFNQIKGLEIISGGSGYNNSAGVTTTIYSAELSNPSIAGRNAAVRAVISVGNTVSSVRIVDPGSAYGIGNTLTVSSSPAGAPTSSAVVRVTEISNNIGDTLELSGFVDPKYNGIFKIVDVPSSRSISIYNPSGIGLTYVPRNDSYYPLIALVSSGTNVSSISYTKETGIATVTCSTSHGLIQGNTFSFVGTGKTFSGKYVVSNAISLTSFNFNAGISTVALSISPTGVTVHKYGLSANAKALGSGEENLGSRGSTFYASLETTLSSPLTKTASSLVLTSSSGINKGDYLSINSEIVRVSQDPTTSTVSVIRGQFSTFSNEAPTGTIVRKIRILPVEIRRHSILRASGHTFEYLGYGPGNYSTAFPVKQDRVLSEDEVLTSQAREQNGGTVVYTGMNDRGEFYSGATKINGATGEEKVIEAPIVTYYGDDADIESANKNTGVFDDVVIKNRVVVEGGENNNQSSQFYGPVNFLEKVSNTSEDGIDTKNLFIRGTSPQSKLITVGIQTPTELRRNGDIILSANPDVGGHIGHVYVDGDWRRWGMISREKNSDFLTLDRIGIGQSAGIYNFSDPLEVNGTVKIKNLYVGGAVTFAQNQTFSGVTYDEITVVNTITLTGAGSSNYTIKHPNANSISQFRNLEVTGTAATFTTASVTMQSALNSTFVGVSTFVGTLNVNNLISNSGVVTATTLRSTELTSNNCTVTGNAYINSGIVTNLSSTTGTVRNLFTDTGIITSISGVAATITTISATSGFINGLRATSSFTTPLAYVNTGVTTTLSGTNLTYSRGNVGLLTVTNFITTDWIGSPVTYVNTGFSTNIVSNYIGGGLNSQPLTVSANVGIITSITGVGATYSNIRTTGNLETLNLFANVGVVTITTGVQASYTGIVTAQRFVSSVANGTAPFQVTSSTKVNNLNADLLDGYDTSTTNTPNTIVVRDGSGNISVQNLTVSQVNGNLQYGVGVSSPLTITNNTSFNNSESKTIGINASSSNTANYVVQRDASGNFSAGTITATLSGNATSATTATNLSGGSVSATSGSFSSGLSVSNGLSVSGNISATGDITAFASDIRLKTDIEPIKDALNKVSKLNGFTYRFNSVAKSLGLSKSDEKIVGVSAQEVQSVLPEAVKPAPIDNNYLTVQYEKLVPLLIESIKELKGELDDLKTELNNLKSDK